MSDSNKILLVEDNAIVAMHLQMSLEAVGHQVVLAATGARAVELARANEVTLCVMDINLPGDIDGFAAASEIRRFRETPMIFVSGYDDEQFRARADECGCIAFLVKPISNDALLALIADGLQG